MWAAAAICEREKIMEGTRASVRRLVSEWEGQNRSRLGVACWLLCGPGRPKKGGVRVPAANDQAARRTPISGSGGPCCIQLHSMDRPTEMVCLRPTNPARWTSLWTTLNTDMQLLEQSVDDARQVMHLLMARRPAKTGPPARQLARRKVIFRSQLTPWDQPAGRLTTCRAWW